MSVPQVQALPEGWSTQRLGSVVQRNNQRDPTRDPEAEFEYVDVSSVSRESLRITHANRLRGSDAPSRARKAIKQIHNEALREILEYGRKVLFKKLMP